MPSELNSRLLTELSSSHSGAEEGNNLHFEYILLKQLPCVRFSPLLPFHRRPPWLLFVVVIMVITAEVLKYEGGKSFCAVASTFQILLTLCILVLAPPYLDRTTVKQLVLNFEYWFLLVTLMVNIFSGMIWDTRNITAWQYTLAVIASYFSAFVENLILLIFDSYMARGRMVKMIKLLVLFLAFLNDCRILIWLKIQWEPQNPASMGTYNQLYISTLSTLMLFRVKFFFSVFFDKIILLKQKVAIGIKNVSCEPRENSKNSLGESIHSSVSSQTLTDQTIYLCPTHPIRRFVFKPLMRLPRMSPAAVATAITATISCQFLKFLWSREQGVWIGWIQLLLTIFSFLAASPFFDRTVVIDVMHTFDFWFLLSYVVASMCSGLFTDLHDEIYASKFSEVVIASSYFAFFILVVLSLLADGWHGDKKIKSCVVLFSLLNNVYLIVVNWNMKSTSIDLVVASTSTRIVYLASLIQISIFFAKFVVFNLFKADQLLIFKMSLSIRLVKSGHGDSMDMFANKK